MRWIFPLLVCAAWARAEEPRPPNILLLFADDAGYADFGFQQQPAPDMANLTPRIDSLAQQGARFSNAYVSGCVCSPSRAGLLTGRYQCRFGHEQNIPRGYMKGGLPLSERTIADRLRALGYRTGLVGKWHLGYPDDYQPNQRGFDWFFGLLQGGRSYYPLSDPSAHQVLQENGAPTPEGGYVTDRIGDAAVRFIDEHKQAPFFLFVSFTAPHGPLQPKAADLRTLEGVEGGKRRKYAGLVKCLDDNVGKILAALREHDLERNTLVVFTNDNGGQTKTGASNAPLRGRKGQLLEGGIRVPMCVRWPGRIEAGSTIDHPVIALDLLPTFLAVAGGNNDPDWKLDGVDLSAALAGEALEERPLFWRTGGPGGEIAMRLGRHKLYFANRGALDSPQLFDLSEDIGEKRDLAAQQPELVARMRGLLEEWESQLMAPRWSSRPSRRR